MSAKQRQLTRRLDAIQEVDPHYINFSKLGITPQEYIDQRTQEIATSPEWEEWRDALRKEKEARHKESEGIHTAFMIKRRAELAEMDAEEDEKF